MTSIKVIASPKFIEAVKQEMEAKNKRFAKYFVEIEKIKSSSSSNGRTNLS